MVTATEQTRVKMPWLRATANDKMLYLSPFVVSQDAGCLQMLGDSMKATIKFYRPVNKSSYSHATSRDALRLTASPR